MRIRWTPSYQADSDSTPQGGASGGRDPIQASDLLTKYGEALKLAEKLADVLNDNYLLREKNRTLTHQVAEATAQVPAAESVVLSAAQAAQWQAYQALGAPDVLKTTVERATTLERAALFQQAATAHGYKATTLAKLPSVQGQTLTMRETLIDGTPVATAYVGDVPLPEYLMAHDADLLPALTVDAAPSNVPILHQPGPSTSTPDLVSAYLQKRNAAVGSS